MLSFPTRFVGRSPRSAVWIAVLAFWALGIGAGARILLRYAQTPGVSATPPGRWPHGAPITLTHGRYSLLLFAHPQCPCTRASLGELALIIARCPECLDVTVFVSVPHSAPEDWNRGGLWEQARLLPSVRVLRDVDGAWARLFGAHTSGQTLLYDADGKLRFQGGITLFRGHSGDNDGRDAVAAILHNQTPRHTVTPVFGCALFGEI